MFLPSELVSLTRIDPKEIARDEKKKKRLMALIIKGNRNEDRTGPNDGLCSGGSVVLTH